jgi:hypothetical protein
VTFYEFEKDWEMQAGTKIRIYADSTGQDFSAEGPDVTVRFGGTPGEASGTRFPADGVDIRVINEIGESIHRRYFISNADYSSLGVRVLRKADGTNFVLVLQSPTEFSAGEYRFRLKYSKSVSKLPVLSQAGDQSPEIVTVDIPWETSNN